MTFVEARVVGTYVWRRGKVVGVEAGDDVLDDRSSFTEAPGSANAVQTRFDAAMLATAAQAKSDDADAVGTASGFA